MLNPDHEGDVVGDVDVVDSVDAEPELLVATLAREFRANH